MSEYNIQMNKYNALNAEYDQLYPKPMKHASTHAKDGDDPILPSNIGAASLDDSGKVPVDQLPFKPQIIVTATTGSTVIATLGSKTYTATESAGTWTFDVDEYGVYTVTGTLGADTESKEVEVDAVRQYTVKLVYPHIYGVEWDGTSTTVWTRTDKAAGFTDPVPYVAGASNYGSPFDDLYPWSGMVRVTDSEAGELVAIPKFWYKWTKSGNSLKLQISDKENEGFYTSPAHMDRGDGEGERDIVYIGRYHCNNRNYQSTSGEKPRDGVARSDARTSIHARGDTIWQSDFAMRTTIWMLYLVEFADWDSQRKIGIGGGNDSATGNMGYTDSMPYHTGTTKGDRAYTGLGTQYRYIEGLWDNVYDWCDGCYYDGKGLNIIINPSDYSESSNGTFVGKSSHGMPSAFTVSTLTGLEWVIYPTEANGSDSTYSTDRWYTGSSSATCICFGGYYSSDYSFGLFAEESYADNNFGLIGCRLMKLPKKEAT